jgi:Putative metal-binding motif
MLSFVRWTGVFLLLCLLTLGAHGCDNGSMATRDTGGGGDGARGDANTSACPNGTDNDNDGYGLGCPKGKDCDDENPLIHPGAKEVCNGKDDDCDGTADNGALNACGTCDPGCDKLGDKPFPLDSTQDPGVKDANGVGLDKNGDLTLDKTKKNFNFMWIANAYDKAGASCTAAQYPACRGTLSKIDTVSLKEVARYFTITCKSKPGASGCVDLHGKAIVKDYPNAPSRTAVDYNFDVWVANRAFGGQPSATKVANDLTDCIDRNGNKTIDTSKDHNSDGKIEIDCDGNGLPDSASTTCSGAFAGAKPEFLGDDDECVLFTINYGDTNDYGRSVCLGAGIDIGASNAWVGTWNHKSGSTYANRFYKINGKTGALAGPYPIAAGHSVYGCVVDSKRILWAVDYGGLMTYLNTVTPTQVGPLLKPPQPATPGFYGVTSDGNDHIWAGGWSSGHVYRYKPDRTSFASLGTGKWTALKQPALFDYSRGIAADIRGKVWVAINKGYIWRVDQSLTDGYHDLSASTDYWPTKNSTVIGVGVDFAGHVWGISYAGNEAARMDVDSKGDPISPTTLQTKLVPVGTNPYTYSDFTGYGLQNFTRPQGRYLYQLAPCTPGHKATWKRVSWNATVPGSTSIDVRVRSGDVETNLGAWYGPYQSSPVLLEKNSTNPLVPNPSMILQVEFTLKTTNKNVQPILHDFDVAYSCAQTPG